MNREEAIKDAIEFFEQPDDNSAEVWTFTKERRKAIAEALRTRPEVEAKVPPAVRIAIRLLLNHVEPGWENCQLVVQSWLDDAVPAAAVERREPQNSEGRE